VTYPDVDTISDRLPYSPQALGFADSTAYDDTLGNIRDEEIERIEEWGSVVNTQADADALHDGSDPRTAFEQFTVKNDVDGTHAVRTPREHIEETRHVRGDLFFELDKDAHRHEGKRRRALPLPGRPVQSVSSVEDLDRDITLTLDEDVYLENAAALVLDDHAPIAEWHSSRRNIQVEYTFGFDGVPGRVAAALVNLVHWRLAQDQSLPVNSESVGGESSDYKSSEEILAEAFGTVLSQTEEEHHGGVFSV